MDIYKFINSKDIEKHCRDIQFKFSPLESAFLIWQSRKHTIQEKHSAYIEVMKESPEFSFYLREWDHKKISLQKFLREYMRIENKLSDFLASDKMGAFTYINSADDVDCNYLYNEKIYSSKRICLNAIRKFEQKCNWNKCKMIYRPILSDTNAKSGLIILHISDELRDTVITEKATLSSDDNKIFHTFDEMKIEVPLPFKDHDILIERYVYCAVPFEYKMNEFQFSDTGLGLSSWMYHFEEEIYVSNYLNLEYAPKAHLPEYDSNDEDVPF